MLSGIITRTVGRCLSVAIGALGFAAPLAYADSISPTSFSANLGIGDSVTVRKTVTITDAPTSALLDVMFVFDITGSMGGAIGGAKATAGSVLTTLSGLGNVASGTGWYADPTFNGVKTNLSTTAANTIASINSLDACNAGSGFNSALCGGDFPEVGFDGVRDAAQNASWRAGSNRFIVVFGDATFKTTATGTLANTLAALGANNVDLIGVNFGSIAGDITALGGDVFASSTAPGDIANAIISGITGSLAEYDEVTVGDLGAGAPGIGLDVVCVSADIGTCVGDTATGDYDRSIARTFEFDVTFTRLAGGLSAFDTHALVDGGIVASEADRFPFGATVVPVPGTLLLLAFGLLGLGFTRRALG